MAIDEEEVVIEGECRMRVKEREGCVLVADKCGGMARVVMTMLRGLAVEIVFASRVVSVISSHLCPAANEFKEGGAAFK